MEKDEDTLFKAILRVRRKIEEGVTDEKKIKYLQHLKNLPITLKVLKATSIGKLVNNLRKEDGIIGDIAKELIFKWKDVATSEKQPSPEKKVHVTTTTTTENNSKLRKDLVVSKSPSKYNGQVIASKEKSFAKQFNSTENTSHKPNSSSSMVTSKQRIPSKESSFARQNFPDTFNNDNISGNHKSENKNKKHSSSVTLTSDKIQTTSKADIVESGDDDNVSQEEKPKMSFQDMLMMPMLRDVNKKKKRKHDNNRINKLKTDKVSLPALPDIILPEYTPEPVYRPHRPVFQPDPEAVKKKTSGVLKLNEIKSRKSKSAIFSGKKVSSGIVTSLHQQCMRVLIENIDSLYETGGVPYFVLEPLLSKCTPQQLERLEYYNPHFVDDSDVLWKKHCQHDFKAQRINQQEDEEWRDVYKRLSTEREERLKRLSSKITEAQNSKLPERSAKLAYISGAPKPSSQMLRKQKRYGTASEDGEKRKEIRDRMDHDQRSSAESIVPFSKVPRRDRCAVRPPSSLSKTKQFDIAPTSKKKKSSLGSNSPSIFTPQGVRKPAKKPMMAAAMKLLKKQKGRISSSIIRR